MILIIDNYDSFTYNLSAYFSQLGEEVIVQRNDAITVKEIRTLKPDYIIISPGPCTPNEAGISKEVILEFYNSTPILGVCLGHQSIAAAFGGKIVRSVMPVHGMKDDITYEQDPIFDNIPNPFPAARYHSLVADNYTLPDFLNVIARNKEEIIMAIKHSDFPCYGFQFHPESILTEHGKELLRNFLKIGEKHCV